MENSFFYPNICHVCKKSGNELPLKRCSRCNMIWYCSKEHQKAHWRLHKQICNAIWSAKFINNHLNRKVCSLHDWHIFRSDLMFLVIVRICRRFKRDELQMMLFPKMCAVCYEQDLKLLEDCKNCPNTAFCTKHKDDSNHKEVCHLFKLCFDMDMVDKYRPLPIKFNLPHSQMPIDLPKDTKTFVDTYMKVFDTRKLSAEVQTIFNAMYVSRPLTLLYMLQKLKYNVKSTFILHVIGADATEIESMGAWELVFHYHPNITSLKIIFVGPEVPTVIKNINRVNDICEFWVAMNKTLSFEFHNTIYDLYMKSKSFLKPDLIIGYNLGIHEDKYAVPERDTWSPCIRLLAQHDYIFILTAYTLKEGYTDIASLREILNDIMHCIYSGENPYRSLRPYRDFQTGKVYFENQYVMVYTRSNNVICDET